MMLAQAVDAAVRRGSGATAYLGTVTGVDAALGALTVDLGTGSGMPGVRWVEPYTPTVGDLVVVLRVGASGWWVLGRNSYDLTGGSRPVQGELTVTAAASYSGVRDAAWSWAPADPGTGLSQGLTGWGGVFAGVAVMPALAPLVPSGATITSAKIRFTRLSAGGAGSGGPALVSPALYGHAYSGQPAGEPGWSTSLWSPGRLSAGQSAQWDLPSSWLTALLAGSMHGVGLFSKAAADFSSWSPPTVTLTYTTPA